MANLKFSQFVEHSDPANVQFVVGYDGSDNVRISPSNMLSGYLPLTGGSISGSLNVQQQLTSSTFPMVNFTATRNSSTYGANAVSLSCVEYGIGMKVHRVSSVGTNAIAFFNMGSQIGSISLGTSSTVYGTTSDYRLKENISPILNGIDRLKQLQPKRFNFIGDDQVVDGFLAHEAQEVIPESVTGSKDEVLPNGDPVYQAIDQGKLVPLLTAALQEAIAKIEFLETRIETLENA